MLGVLRTIPVGNSPDGVAVDAESNRIYVANALDDTVSVIDGNTGNVVNTIAVGKSPFGLAVYRDKIEVRRPGMHSFLFINRVYVACWGDGTVWVLEDTVTGLVAASPPLAVGAQPTGVAVDGKRGRVYVLSALSSILTVFDGRASIYAPPLTSIQIPTDNGMTWRPQAVAVNPETNQVYVTAYGGQIWVIDGNNWNVPPQDLSQLGVNLTPGVAVNAKTNMVYFTNHDYDDVLVFDETTQKYIYPTIGLPGAGGPSGVAVNPAFNTVYVAETYAGQVAVIDGSTASVVTTVKVGVSPESVAVNPKTNLVYVTNFGDPTGSAGAGKTVTVLGDLPERKKP